MQDLALLRDRFILYANHGGPWNYIENQLVTYYDVMPDLAHMIVNHIRSYDLCRENGERAKLYFNTLIMCIQKRDYSSYTNAVICCNDIDDIPNVWLSIVLYDEITVL
ncbi:TPA: hypothetical protein ACX6SQ_003794 [Photobacterium damselae]|uniref:hypothetical protein n=1 Tax=Photobacterium damselae TaxID=38293 RepID=UPI004067AED5